MSISLPELIKFHLQFFSCSPTLPTIHSSYNSQNYKILLQFLQLQIPLKTLTTTLRDTDHIKHHKLLLQLLQLIFKKSITPPPNPPPKMLLQFFQLQILLTTLTNADHINHSMNMNLLNSSQNCFNYPLLVNSSYNFYNFKIYIQILQLQIPLTTLTTANSSYNSYNSYNWKILLQFSQQQISL